MKAQAAEKVKAQVQKVKDKAQAIVDDIAVSREFIDNSMHVMWMDSSFFMFSFLPLGLMSPFIPISFQADKAVAEEKLEAARPALEEAEAALQVKNIFIMQSWGRVWRSRAPYSAFPI